MSAAMIAGLAGLAMAIASYFMLERAAVRLEGLKPTPETAKRGRLLRAIAACDLFILPIVGYLTGQVLWS